MALDDAAKKVLCGIARQSLAAALENRPYRPAAPTCPGLEEKRGCFVTLRTNGELRGCLGCFTSENPLYLTVADYTRFSALDDPRFASRRLRPEDTASVHIDISALTPLEPCPDPRAIVLGEHGIYVKKGARSGCFLPQVATEMGWNLEEFLGYCCRDKAGLDWFAWRDPGTDIMVFKAEVFDCGEC